MTQKGWWYRASQEQRLRQIDAGIELGMTAKQVAMVSGTMVGTVFSFSRLHGRHFYTPATVYSKKGNDARWASVRAHHAYFSGRPVDEIWRNAPRQAVASEVEEIILE